MPTGGGGKKKIPPPPMSDLLSPWQFLDDSASTGMAVDAPERPPTRPTST